MAQRFIKGPMLAVLVGCISLVNRGSAAAEPFGRYGYHPWPKSAGMVFNEQGFRANVSPAQTLRFDTPLVARRAIATSPYGQTVGFGINRSGPSKGRFTTTAPGFALYFPGRWRLRISSIGSPYLTWPGGSATAGVPTPPSSWILVSFLDQQPAWMIGFPDGPAALKVTGRPGNWVLESPPDFKGWVRFGLPFGLDRVQANSAASLGDLTERAIKVAPLFEQKAPELQRVSVSADDQSVTGTWEFDRPGAIIPSAVRMAAIVGSAVKCQSETISSGIVTEEGPVDVVASTRLTVRFPVVKIPTGRAIGLGAVPDDSAATIAFTDPGSVADLSLRIRLSNTPIDTVRMADQASRAYLSQLILSPEPNTGQPMPFDLKGIDLDLIAAHGLLAQAISTNKEVPEPMNSLLTSLSWRMDWGHWRILDGDRATSRKAAILASLAGAFSDTPEGRLVGAMWNAGLDGERGFDRWQRRRAQESRATAEAEPLRPDPYLGFRRQLFGSFDRKPADAPILKYFASPARLFGDIALDANVADGRLFLGWTATDARLAGFATSFTATWAAKSNLASIGGMTRGNIFDLSYASSAPGRVEAWVDFDGSIDFPPVSALPRYDATPIKQDRG